MEVSDDVGFNGDAEERRHIINQESGNQEGQPLVAAPGPRAAPFKVNVGDLGQRHGYCTVTETSQMAATQHNLRKRRAEHRPICCAGGSRQ